MQRIFFVFLLICLFPVLSLFQAFKNSREVQSGDAEAIGCNYCDASMASFCIHDTTITIGQVPVDFLFPEGTVQGVILVLPGWNFSRSDICRKSVFCSKAKNAGWAVILPEMLKSVYSSRICKETRADWKGYPSLHWITDTLIPYCRKQFHFLVPGNKNVLFGISTGARGVALVAESTGHLFLSGAALSGDYDQRAMPNDPLMNGYYGSYQKFRERWEGPDNPFLHSGLLKTPLYLAHGKLDPVVPYQQTQSFYRKISKENPDIGHTLHLCDTCRHNYFFWNAELDSVFAFFGHTCRRIPGK